MNPDDLDSKRPNLIWASRVHFWRGHNWGAWKGSGRSGNTNGKEFHVIERIQVIRSEKYKKHIRVDKTELKVPGRDLDARKGRISNLTSRDRGAWKLIQVPRKLYKSKVWEEQVYHWNQLIRTPPSLLHLFSKSSSDHFINFQQPSKIHAFILLSV